MRDSTPSGTPSTGRDGAHRREPGGPGADGTPLQSTALQDEPRASTGLFDLRYLIGGLFVVYGLMLAVANFFVSNVKAGGIDINLWLGLAMFVLGAFFLVWARARPLHVEGTSAAAQQAQGQAAPGHEAPAHEAAPHGAAQQP